MRRTFIARCRNFFRDIILNPEQTDLYKHLKDSGISHDGESKLGEIRRLLAGEQLRDRKPSALLRTTQRHAESHNISNELLLELFMQQLPSNIQFVLASIQPLMLQRILEVSPIQVNSTVLPSVISLDPLSYSELLKEIIFEKRGTCTTKIP